MRFGECFFASTIHVRSTTYDDHDGESVVQSFREISFVQIVFHSFNFLSFFIAAIYLPIKFAK